MSGTNFHRLFAHRNQTFQLPQQTSPRRHGLGYPESENAQVRLTQDEDRNRNPELRVQDWLQVRHHMDPEEPWTRRRLRRGPGGQNPPRRSDPAVVAQHTRCSASIPTARAMRKVTSTEINGDTFSGINARAVISKNNQGSDKKRSVTAHRHACPTPPTYPAKPPIKPPSASKATLPLAPTTEKCECRRVRGQIGRGQSHPFPASEPAMAQRSWLRGTAGRILLERQPVRCRRAHTPPPNVTHASCRQRFMIPGARTM